MQRPIDERLKAMLIALLSEPQRSMGDNWRNCRRVVDHRPGTGFDAALTDILPGWTAGCCGAVVTGLFQKENDIEVAKSLVNVSAIISNAITLKSEPTKTDVAVLDN